MSKALTASVVFVAGVDSQQAMLLRDSELDKLVFDPTRQAHTFTLPGVTITQDNEADYINNTGLLIFRNIVTDAPLSSIYSGSEGRKIVKDGVTSYFYERVAVSGFGWSNTVQLEPLAIVSPTLATVLAADNYPTTRDALLARFHVASVEVFPPATLSSDGVSAVTEQTLAGVRQSLSWIPGLKPTATVTAATGTAVTVGKAVGFFAQLYALAMYIKPLRGLVKALLPDAWLAKFPGGKTILGIEGQPKAKRLVNKAQRKQVTRLTGR